MQRSLQLLVTLIGSLALLQSALGQERPSQETWPQLITPQTPGQRFDSEGVALPKDVLRRCGSGLFRRGSYPGLAPFVSPSGKTVYAPDGHELLAYDSATGQIRFEYRYSAWNLRVTDLGTEGIRVDLHQGPAAGIYIVLEHDTGRELRRGKRVEHVGKGPNSITFADGRRAIVFRPKPQRTSIPEPYIEQIATLWDLKNDRELVELGELIPGLGTGGLSPQEDRLALTTGGRLRIFDTEDGKLLHDLDLGTQDRRDQSALWGASGKKVYAWTLNSKESQLLEVDARSGQCRVILDHWQNASGNILLSPDERFLACYRNSFNQPGMKAGWLILDLVELTEIATIDLRAMNSRAAFSPDMKSLWLLGECGLMRYDIGSKQIATPRVDPVEVVSALSFSADGQRLFGAAGRELLTWEVATGNEIAPRQQFSAAFPQHNHMECTKIDPTGSLTLWRGNSHVHLLSNGKELSKSYAANSRENRVYAVTTDLRQIVHDAYWGELIHADLRTGKTLHTLLPKVQPRQSYLMAMSPNNKTLAVVHGMHTIESSPKSVDIEFWDLARGKVLGKVSQIGDLLMEMHFSGDSQELRVWHRELTRWDVATRKKIDERPTQQEPSLYLGFSPDRKYYLKHGSRKLQLVHTVSDRIVKTWECYDWRATATAFSPDGKMLAVGAPEGPVFLVKVDLSTP